MIVVGAIAFFVLIFGRGIASFWIDLLWHRALGRNAVGAGAQDSGALGEADDEMALELSVARDEEGDEHDDEDGCFQLEEPPDGASAHEQIGRAHV